MYGVTRSVTSLFIWSVVCMLCSFSCLSSLVLQGTLKGFDQTINLILDDSFERVYSTSQGVEQVVLGLYIIRGDNV